ncbi:MAG TPA: diguanylate cyclase [Smithellaceae bacterium]|jgi:two-component system, cell cycle response regulator|nr:diguanylate cyclase [Smithellaceae bacterium]HQM45662.1 diguanylate cyclase [Smithellaceae bacterium]
MITILPHDEEYMKGLTVLYVEDDEDARKLHTVFLKCIVGNLITAKDGWEGLAAYHAHHPKIIITDIQMPNMDGITMAGEIRKLDKSSHIVVLTAFEEVEYLKNSINIGVDKYVTKPVEKDKLHEILLECAHRLLAEETLQYAAATDSLTGLVNRRELIKQFQVEKSKSERHGTSLAVMMADIDHFKEVNDIYGHNAGDRILKGVSHTIRSSLRVEDICGRWGGEEFLLILPETDLSAAASVAEKLLMAVRNLSTPWEGKNISVTISLGVNQFVRGMDMETCIGRADEALYRAKAGGRNRFEMAVENR